MKDNLGKLSVFLTPAGAGIAIICFFLPWVRVSCGTITVEASGGRIGGILWLVLAAALIILAAFIYRYFRQRRDLFKLKLITLLSGGAAIIIMIYKFISAFAGDGADIRLSDFWSVIRFGAIGELLGLLMAMGGAFVYRRVEPIQRISLRRYFGALGERRRAKETRI